MSPSAQLLQRARHWRQRQHGVEGDLWGLWGDFLGRRLELDLRDRGLGKKQLYQVLESPARRLGGNSSSSDVFRHSAPRREMPEVAGGPGGGSIFGRRYWVSLMPG
jgi:hypothetical protein